MLRELFTGTMTFAEYSVTPVLTPIPDAERDRIAEYDAQSVLEGYKTGRLSSGESAGAPPRDEALAKAVTNPQLGPDAQAWKDGWTWASDWGAEEWGGAHGLSACGRSSVASTLTHWCTCPGRKERTSCAIPQGRLRATPSPRGVKQGGWCTSARGRPGGGRSLSAAAPGKRAQRYSQMASDSCAVKRRPHRQPGHAAGASTRGQCKAAAGRPRAESPELLSS